LLEREVDLAIGEVYRDWKTLMLEKGCVVIAEEPPKSISVRQGSVWGLSPRTAKKVINCRLSSVGSSTRMAVSSSLAADWKNLTIIGSVLSIVVATVCWWISADLSGFIATQQPSFWSWIATSGGFSNLEAAQSFAVLTQVLAVFLVTIVLLEIIIFAHAKSRVDVFAEETLKTLL
jgi:hypothetical protein